MSLPTSPKSERWGTLHLSADGTARWRVGVVDGHYIIAIGATGNEAKYFCDRATMSQMLADICHFFNIRAIIEGVSGAPIEPMDLDKR